MKWGRTRQVHFMTSQSVGCNQFWAPSFKVKNQWSCGRENNAKSCLSLLKISEYKTTKTDRMRFKMCVFVRLLYLKISLAFVFSIALPAFVPQNRLFAEINAVIIR